MEKQKFFDLLTAVCNYRSLNTKYIAPFLNLSNQNPNFAEKEFGEFLETVFGQVREQSLGQPDSKIISATLREVLFDGVGYFVPCIGCYVNTKPEKQILNDSRIVNNVIVPFYNYEKDAHFNGFLRELVINYEKNKFEAWIKHIGAQHDNQITEYTQDLNTDNKGLKSLTKPFIKEGEQNG